MDAAEFADKIAILRDYVAAGIASLAGAGMALHTDGVPIIWADKIADLSAEQRAAMRADIPADATGWLAGFRARL